MRAPSPDDRCQHCGILFGYVMQEGDPVALCTYCKSVMHEDCLERHVCVPKMAADREKLARWVESASG